MENKPASPRRPWTYFLLAVAAGWTCGCASVEGVHDKAGSPSGLTAEEAHRIWDEAIRLGAQQPRTLERMSQVAPMLDEVARTLTNEYDVECQAAEAWEFVAENAPHDKARIDAAKRGLTIARHGQALQPDRVECHYWYAINVGLLADADRTYGLKAVAEIEAALKHANELDDHYDFAGPSRVLGILYLRTPAPPVSIGSTRKGLRMLQAAHQLFPGYPENELYLAEALKENGHPEEACRLVQQVIDAPLWPDRQYESARWKIEARKILTCPPPK